MPHCLPVPFHMWGVWVAKLWTQRVSNSVVTLPVWHYSQEIGEVGGGGIEMRKHVAGLCLVCILGPGSNPAATFSLWCVHGMVFFLDFPPACILWQKCERIQSAIKKYVRIRRMIAFLDDLSPLCCTCLDRSTFGGFFFFLTKPIETKRRRVASMNM